MRIVGLLEDGETQEGNKIGRSHGQRLWDTGVESCLQAQSKRVPGVLKALLVLSSNSSGVCDSPGFR